MFLTFESAKYFLFIVIQRLVQQKSSTVLVAKYSPTWINTNDQCSAVITAAALLVYISFEHLDSDIYANSSLKYCSRFVRLDGEHYP